MGSGSGSGDNMSMTGFGGGNLANASKLNTHIRSVKTKLGTVLHWTGVEFSVTGLRLREHFFEVPLAYDPADDDSYPRILLFAREVIPLREHAETMPCLLYLQGGPGFESPRPVDAGGWLSKACESFRVILMDQRGTGRSTRIDRDLFEAFGSAQEQFDFVKHFRADNIVRDAEVIRECLCPGQPWSTLGQSFGGFCTLTYLSMFPDSVRESIVTGGLAPVTGGCTADRVYDCCFRRVQTQNERYYVRFPDDVKKVSKVFEHLLAQPQGVRTPAGNTLTPRSLQLLGLGFGSAHYIEEIHYLFENAWNAKGELSYNFLKSFDSLVPFNGNILYALLHEAIYCEGEASRWAAHRARARVEQSVVNFDATRAVESGLPVFFTGEMVFPWMFDELAELRPLKDLAEIAAAHEEWPKLYDRQRLQSATASVAAAVYLDDMYVDFDLSMETARDVKGIRLFATNEYLHSGLRENGAHLFDKLLKMARNAIPIR